MTTNLLNPYSNLTFSYPIQLFNWQRALLKPWFDIWTKTLPTGFNWAGQTIAVQEKLIQFFLEIEEKSLEQSLESQKQFWENYFQLLGNGNNPKQPRPLETTAKLEEFPSSAKLEEFPTSAKRAN